MPAYSAVLHAYQTFVHRHIQYIKRAAPLQLLFSQRSHYNVLSLQKYLHWSNGTVFAGAMKQGIESKVQY